MEHGVGLKAWGSAPSVHWGKKQTGSLTIGKLRLARIILRRMEGRLVALSDFSFVGCG